MNDVRQLPDGTLALDYECHDVSDHETAKQKLNDAVKHDDVKKTIVKSSKNDATTAKPQPKPTNQHSESYSESISLLSDKKLPALRKLSPHIIVLTFITGDFIHHCITPLLSAI